MPNTTRKKEDRPDASDTSSSATAQKWGALASFLLAVALFAPEPYYLMGNLRDAFGPLAYNVADFFYGPVRAAGLVAAAFALRERIGALAPRRASLAFLAAVLAAGAMISVAFIRSANRHYHLHHPELHLENDSTVLIVWTTLVAGLIGTAWHFWGWSLLLMGSAGWASGRLPRMLIGLYWLVGLQAMFVYLVPEFEGGVILLGMVICIWQGIVLLMPERGKTPAPKINASQPDPA